MEKGTSTNDTELLVSGNVGNSQVSDNNIAKAGVLTLSPGQEKCNKRISKGDRWQQLVELQGRRRNLVKQIQDLHKQLKPLEFESYYEYFLINTFQKGVSASGRVDVESLLRREHNIYYSRIERESATSTSQGLTDSTDSLDNLDSPVSHLEKEINDPITDIGSAESTTSLVDTKIQREPISTKSVRRSTRLSQKLQDLEKEKANNPPPPSEDEAVHIHDLFESLVPKVLEPCRRSDWVLPSRFRYTPERRMYTKPEHEVIKVHELISTKQLQEVLSRFEGGLAGIRKNPSA